MSTEKYQGWTNRETWCAALWIGNREDLYLRLRGAGVEQIREAITHGVGTGNVREDIGDLSRVNWVEVANYLSEE